MRLHTFLQAKEEDICGISFLFLLSENSWYVSTVHQERDPVSSEASLQKPPQLTEFPADLSLPGELIPALAYLSIHRHVL